MSDDYGDYDERPQVPTFSDGFYVNKGAKSTAESSRILASKNALAVASRSFAMMATSMQQLKYNTQPIVNSQHPVAPKNTVNKLAIQAAEKRNKYMIQQIISSTQNANIASVALNHDEDNTQPIVNSQQPVAPNNAVNKLAIQTTERKTKYMIQQIISSTQNANIASVALNHDKDNSVTNLDIYRDIVITTSNRKKLLLETYTYSAPKIFKNNRKVLLVQSTSPEIPQLDPSLISTLSSNLAHILKSASDNNEILNEFDRYKFRVRISLEEPIHKSVVEKARIIKNTYFTSDT